MMRLFFSQQIENKILSISQKCFLSKDILNVNIHFYIESFRFISMHSRRILAATKKLSLIQVFNHQGIEGNVISYQFAKEGVAVSVTEREPLC